MTADKPVFVQSSAPDHGPDFWNELDAKMQEQQVPDDRVTPLRPSPTGAPQAGRRRGRVLAMAAAVVLLVGVGAFVLSRPTESDRSTELVVESNASATAAAAAVQVPTSETTERVPIEDAPAPRPTSLTVVDGSATQADRPTPTPTPSGESSTAVEVPVAAGTVLETSPVYLPASGSSFGALPTTLLGTWADQRLSWFEWVDDAESCDSGRYSGIGYVNEAGIALPASDWGRTFSGAVSHFTPSNDLQQVAWIVSCAAQLEVYVARLTPTPGVVSDIRLAWVGEGSSSVAFMLWDDSTVSLNTVDSQGQPFFVDIDVAARSVIDSSDEADPTAPTELDSMIVGATATGSFTYWNGTAPESMPSCDSTENTLWVRNSLGEWSQAVAEVPVSSVVAFDVDSVLSLAAFADACDGANVARVLVGTLRGDGLISSVRVIDLGAYAPGFVSELFWVEPNVLRIHTDNSEFGGEVLRFDYVFDEGRDGGILTQLDA